MTRRTFSSLVPEAYVLDTVTGSNWEGGGVVPDVVCEPDEALEEALATVADPGAEVQHGPVHRGLRSE